MSDRKYYRIAGLASENFEANAGLSTIKKLSREAESILDVGCGEGTRLAQLGGMATRFGVDINDYAINQARSRYKGIKFLKYDGIRLPFDDGSFDLVYSAYVLEHTTRPFPFIDEMIRVLKKGGQLCLITPNFGAPNRRSPNSAQTKINKLMTGLSEDFLRPDIIELTSVIPKKIYRSIDDDTTVEPYLRKIIKYLKYKKLTEKEVTSLWDLDEGVGIFWKILRYLGNNGVYPFIYWGPQAFLRYQK